MSSKRKPVTPLLAPLYFSLSCSALAVGKLQTPVATLKQDVLTSTRLCGIPTRPLYLQLFLCIRFNSARMPCTWFAMHLFWNWHVSKQLLVLWHTAVAAFELVLPEILSKASELELCLHVYIIHSSFQISSIRMKICICNIQTYQVPSAKCQVINNFEYY